MEGVNNMDYARLAQANKVWQPLQSSFKPAIFSPNGDAERASFFENLTNDEIKVRNDYPAYLRNRRGGSARLGGRN